jgi:1,2-diacylglycerol 3-alpha-glucosyltransferase
VKIAIFSESYEPVINGVTVSILALTSELKKLGHEIYVFAPGFAGHKDVENRTIRFPSIRTAFARDYPLAIPYMRGLTRKVKELELDVIHTHTPFMLGWLGLRLGRRLGIPVVSTYHTLYTEYVHYFPLAPKSVSRAFIVSMLRRYYNRCAHVITPSTPMEEVLRGYGVTRPITIIPTGLSIDTARDDAARKRIRKEFGIPENARVLLYVGRVAREKHLDLLLEAFDKLAPKYMDTYLMIAGGGPYEAQLRENASKLACGSRIVFTGAVPREKVAKYYSAGDLFAYPSPTETQGIVVCEALGAGLPCVLVNGGGTPEMVVDGTDSLLTKIEVEDFAEKLDKLLSDPALMEAFSKRAVLNAARFSPRSMAEKALEVYESVLI